jgi:superfamily II DNA/RNA helicase
MLTYLHRHSSSFSKLNLDPLLTSRLAALGFTPTRPQRALLPVFQSNSDLVVKDVTASGKTFGLCIGMIQKQLALYRKQKTTTTTTTTTQLDRNQARQEFIQRRLFKRGLDILVIVPTTQLAMQMYTWLDLLSPITTSEQKSTFDIVYSVAGVDSYSRLAKSQIIIGTPTTLAPLLTRTSSAKSNFSSTKSDPKNVKMTTDSDSTPPISTATLRTLIIDEVDRMVSVPSRYEPVSKKFNRIVHPRLCETLVKSILARNKNVIVKRSSSKIQVILCSATINRIVRKQFKVRKWIKNEVLLDLNRGLNEKVAHVGYYVKEKGIVRIERNPDGQNSKSITKKPDGNAADITNNDISQMVLTLQKEHQFKSAMIICPSTHPVLDLKKELGLNGIDAITQSQMKNHVLVPSARVEPGKNTSLTQTIIEHPFIITTEHECRGIDVDVDVVIVIGIVDIQSYVHVSGRTGRTRNGTCISIIPQHMIPKYHATLDLLQRL